VGAGIRHVLFSSHTRPPFPVVPLELSYELPYVAITTDTVLLHISHSPNAKVNTVLPRILKSTIPQHLR